MGVDMSSEFIIWDHKIVPNACSLYELIGIEKEYQLIKGVSRADDFPGDAAFIMHPDRPHDTNLLDNLYNIHNLLVVSKRLKDFLESRPLQKVEFLPITIL